MKPGATKRNIALAAVAVVLFPLTLLLTLFYVPLALAFNREGLADSVTDSRLRRLPGIGGGRVTTALVAFVYLFVAVGVVFASLPADSSSSETNGVSDSDSASVASMSTSTATSSGAAVSEKTRSTALSTESSTMSSTSTPSPARVSTDTSIPTQTATPSPSPTATPTSSPTPTPTATPTPTLTASPTPTPTATQTPEPARGPARGTEWTVTVTRVVDGDTVEVRFPNGETDTLRLLGVDTPETSLGKVSPGEYEDVPDTTSGRDWLYKWGQRASQFATDELDGEQVRIEVDPQADRRGSYGRLLVYVYVDGENFNERLLSEGYARMYDSSFSERSRFADREEEARRNDVGLWDFEAPTPAPTPTPVPTTSTDDVDLPPLPSDGDYDCGHFDTREQAQTVLERESGDPHRLDGDGDGEACESI